MKIKIVTIDFETPRWLRRTLAYVGPIVIVLGIAAVALAGSLHTWNTGDTLQATDLNGNFTNLQTQINSMQATLTQITADGGYLPGARYCGETAATKGSFSGPGALTGYASAKGQCAAVVGCSAASAHMCSTEEMIRSAALQVSVPSSGGWIPSGVSAEGYSDTTGILNTGYWLSDCGSWAVTDNGDQTAGSIWENGGPVTDLCSVSYPIRCCN